MFALKEAVLAKEKGGPDVDTTIFIWTCGPLVRAFNSTG